MNEELFSYSDYVDVDDLEHHGIKGQKWGVRRFQNKDGSLTSKGKSRYSSENRSKDESTSKVTEKLSNAKGKVNTLDEMLSKPTKEMFKDYIDGNYENMHRMTTLEKDYNKALDDLRSKNLSHKEFKSLAKPLKQEYEKERNKTWNVLKKDNEKIRDKMFEDPVLSESMKKLDKLNYEEVKAYYDHRSRQSTYYKESYKKYLDSELAKAKTSEEKEKIKKNSEKTFYDEKWQHDPGYKKAYEKEKNILDSIKKETSKVKNEMKNRMTEGFSNEKQMDIRQPEMWRQSKTYKEFADGVINTKLDEMYKNRNKEYFPSDSYLDFYNSYSTFKKWEKDMNFEHSTKSTFQDLFSYSDYVDTEDIQHFGIKGQKWGIRRFQNKDGSLTSKGRSRYSDADKGGLSDVTNSIKNAIKSHRGEVHPSDPNIIRRIAIDVRNNKEFENHKNDLLKKYKAAKKAEDYLEDHDYINSEEWRNEDRKAYEQTKNEWKKIYSRDYNDRVKFFGEDHLDRDWEFAAQYMTRRDQNRAIGEKEYNRKMKEKGIDLDEQKRIIKDYNTSVDDISKKMLGKNYSKKPSPFRSSVTNKDMVSSTIEYILRDDSGDIKHY